MQPARHDDRTIGQVLFSGFNGKTLLFGVFSMAALFYGLRDKVSVGEERDRGLETRVEEKYGALDKKSESLLEGLRIVRETTLRKDTYDRDQLRLEGTIHDLSERQRTTDQVLMERGFRAK